MTMMFMVLVIIERLELLRVIILEIMMVLVIIKVICSDYGHVKEGPDVNNNNKDDGGCGWDDHEDSIKN